MPETLVVGPNATTRALLCHAFQQQGLPVFALEDGAAALERGLRTTPAAVIAECVPGGFDALGLLQSMRSSSFFARVPFLLLGGETDEQQQAWSLGGLALSWPVFARDVVSLLRFAWATGQGAALPLGEFGALSLVRALAGARVEGQLFLRRAVEVKGPEGQVDFGAEALACRVGHLQGRAALNRLSAWRELHAVWLHTPPTEASPNELLDADAFTEAAHYQAEVRAASAALPPEDSPLFAIAAKRASLPKLPGEVNALLALCEEGPTLAALIEAAPFRALDTMRIVRRLLDLGLLERPLAAEPAPPRPAPLPAAASASPPVVARRIVLLNPAPGEAPPAPPPRPRPPTLEALEESLERALGEETAPEGPSPFGGETVEDLSPTARREVDELGPTVRLARRETQAELLLEQELPHGDPETTLLDELPTPRDLLAQPTNRRLWRMWKKRDNASEHE